MAGVVEAASLSSSDHRDVLKRILLALYLINNPGWLDKTANAIRATITALPTLAAVTTVTTVTTVGTVTTLANVGSWAHDPVIRMQNTAAWALAARARIT